VVREHLRAVFAFDWEALENSLAAHVELNLGSASSVGQEITAAGLYRHISEAWNFYPMHTELSESEPGTVLATIELTNGGCYRKTIRGEYRVEGTRLSCIRLHDSAAREVSS